jgi:hypothetical protein
MVDECWCGYVNVCFFHQDLTSHCLVLETYMPFPVPHNFGTMGNDGGNGPCKAPRLGCGWWHQDCRSCRCQSQMHAPAGLTIRWYVANVSLGCNIERSGKAVTLAPGIEVKGHYQTFCDEIDMASQDKELLQMLQSKWSGWNPREHQKSW